MKRKRWEEGHIRLIAATAPRLIAKSIVTGNLALLSLSLDLIVPPLSLLAMLTVAMFLVTGVSTLLGASATAFDHNCELSFGLRFFLFSFSLVAQLWVGTCCHPVPYFWS